MLGEHNDDHHDLNEVVIKTRIMIRTKVMIRNREMMTATNMVITTRIMIRLEMVIKAKVLIKNLLMIVMIIRTKMKIRATNIISISYRSPRHEKLESTSICFKNIRYFFILKTLQLVIFRGFTASQDIGIFCCKEY